MLISFQFDIHFDFFVFLAFFVGFFFGISFIVLLYLFFALISIKKRRKTLKDFESSVSEECIKDKIYIAQKNFLKQRKETSTFDALKQILPALIHQIAELFYPESKHPLAELSLEELILLDRYIADMIDTILSRKGLRLLRNLKVSLILNILDANTKIQNSTPVKISKGIHLNRIIKIGNLVLNAINPFYWFKRLVVSPSLNLIIKRLFLQIITITGEETYRIYSKRIFHEDEEQEVKLLLEEIEKEDKASEVTSN